MRQEDFFDCKSYTSARYKPLSKYINKHRVKLRDIHWLNFGWGEDTDLRTGRRKLFHHPDEVWVRYGSSKDEPWKKIKSVRNTTLPPRTPEHHYNGTLNLAPAKVKDLKKMASKFIPEPQCQFYLLLQSSSVEDFLSEDEDSDA
ncbi:uncharacterized protein LOC122960850 [Acropora millepora]|uniref:uncharacterized protein LOC122960850 n=1 Tax=Acropora millepora TaxID=45264 RepID=UPI001CF5858A|nr:uncharacterized protein LOC122960850 [Acropora millepora]